MEKTTDKVIALTFDDGPCVGITDPILDVAERYGVRFSFFVVGECINERGASLMRRAHSLGCDIHNHSLTHSDMSRMTADEIKAEIQKTDELVYSVIGEHPRFFRPPYIAVSSTLFESVDMPFICGCGCEDWEDAVSVGRRVRFLTEECKDGCIVLLHDKEGNHKTVEAVEKAVPMLIEQGYKLVTISELFAAKGVTPRADIEKIYSYATD